MRVGLGQREQKKQRKGPVSNTVVCRAPAVLPSAASNWICLVPDGMLDVNKWSGGGYELGLVSSVLTLFSTPLFPPAFAANTDQAADEGREPSLVRQ